MGSDDQKRMSRAETTASRTRQLLESYGSDPARWPEGERAPALAMLGADASLDAARKIEEALDAVLTALPVEDAVRGLPHRILEDFDRHVSSRQSHPRHIVRDWLEKLGDTVWPGAPLWQPVAAISVSLLIGLAAGTLLPEQPAPDTDETVVSSPFDMNVATDSIEPV